jgi:hypothetical protein
MRRERMVTGGIQENKHLLKKNSFQLHLNMRPKRGLVSFIAHYQPGLGYIWRYLFRIHRCGDLWEYKYHPVNFSFSFITLWKMTTNPLLNLKRITLFFSSFHSLTDNHVSQSPHPSAPSLLSFVQSFDSGSDEGGIGGMMLGFYFLSSVLWYKSPVLFCTSLTQVKPFPL